MVKENPILGIIGGGQLGCMLATAAKKLNIKTIILSDDSNVPAKNFVMSLLLQITIMLKILKNLQIK